MTGVVCARCANFCKQPLVGVPCGMARDDLFKKYQEAGAEFLEAARTRAEEFLRSLAQMGDSTQKQAQDAVDDLVEGGRKGTEQILTSIRRRDHRPAVAARSGHQGGSRPTWRAGWPVIGPARGRLGPGREVEQAAPGQGIGTRADARRQPGPGGQEGRRHQGRRQEGHRPRRRGRQEGGRRGDSQECPGQKAAPAKKAPGEV